MRANRFTVVIDANVLGPGLMRNIALSLAEAGLFRPRWSQEILNETQRYIQKRIGDETKAKAHVGKIEHAFDEALVALSSQAINRLTLPDDNDRHVFAAAIKVRAQLIVTNNLKDFPLETLSDFEMEAVSADHFFADVISLDPTFAIASLAKMRLRFKDPKKTAEQLILECESIGLLETSALMSQHIDLL